MIAYKDLSEKARSGFTDWGELGDIYTKEYDDMILFNYTHAAQWNARWNEYERVCRGLVLDANTGEIMALPFERFFNWGERGLNSRSHIVDVTEKLDGSLIIAFVDNTGSWRCVTRGSFISDQALFATDYLNTLHPDIDAPDNTTLLFEVIYPDNRIVIDYGPREDLVLIGARSNITLEDHHWFPYLSKIASANDFSTPRYYAFNSWRAIMDARDKLDITHEGFVAHFADGSRFKFKGDAYMQMHKLISSISFKNTLEAIKTNTYHSLIERLPDEFMAEVQGYHNDIMREVITVELGTEYVFSQRPKSDDRKDFAVWVMKNHKDDAPYLFAMYDGKDMTQLIYKLEF